MGGKVSEERFESDGAAAHEPRVDLEDPGKVSVAIKERKNKNGKEYT